MTTFEPTEESKKQYDGVSSGKKLSVFSNKALFTWGNILTCKHCKESWNDHAGIATKRVPAGMCLTEKNLKESGTYLIEESK